MYLDPPLATGTTFDWLYRTLVVAIVATALVLGSMSAALAATIKYMDSTALANAWYWSGTYTVVGGNMTTGCSVCSITLQTFKNSYQIYHSATGGSSLNFSHPAVADHKSRCQINAQTPITCYVHT